MMTKIKFLGPEHSQYIAIDLKERFYLKNPLIEYGFIEENDKIDLCQLIISDGRRRYKVNASIRYVPKNGLPNAYPNRAQFLAKYSNPALDKDKEKALFELLKAAYLRVNADGTRYLEENKFIEHVQLLLTSSEDITDSINNQFETSRGLTGAVIGLAIALPLYKFSEFAPLPLHNYVSMPAFTLWITFLGGMINAGLSGYKGSKLFKNRVKSLKKSLKDFSADLESRLRGDIPAGA